MRSPSSAGGSPLGGARLSQIFFEQGKLDVSHRMEDGFRDAGPDKNPLLAGVECLLVERQDQVLLRFMERCKKKLRKAKDDVAQAMVLALLVSDICGRSGMHAKDLPHRYTQLASDHRRSTGELLLGDLLAASPVNPERRMNNKQGVSTGAALTPQRAVLFKTLADWLGILGSTLQRQQAATFNVVQIGQMPCIVDLIFDPGALYEDPSPKAQEYRRLLQADAATAGGPLEPPSSRKDLAGHMPRPPWHVEPWELDIQRADRIGRGGFGEVFHGRWCGVRVAVKEMKDNSPSDADVVDFLLEIAVLSQLNHPNIVRFWRGSTELRGGSRSLLMVTEYVKQGGLSRLLHGHGGPALPEPLTLPQALSFGLDVARGVQYLHSQRILHLDLKSPNVLCAPVWTAKLCDFGLAKMRGEATVVQSTLQGVSPVWAPPEMFDPRAGGLTEKADVYSFAVIFFELLTKQVPFSEVTASQLPAAKAAGQLPRIPASVPPDCAELVQQCCAAKPPSRPSMSGAAARVREIAQAHGIQLSEVKPPAALLRYDDDQERRVQEAEESAARRLKDVDKQRAQLRTELSEIQTKIEATRRKSVELAAQRGTGAGAGSMEPAAEADDSWCEPFIQEVAGSKFRCSLCSKLFRGPEFVRRHVAAKHRSDVNRLSEDKYFDCDVSREDSLPAHQAMQNENSPRKALAAAAVLGAGRFSQALQDAAEQGDASQVNILLNLRADPGQRDDGGTGPLALAARNGHVTAIEALLAAAEARSGSTAAVDIAGHTTGAGLTPVHMAAAEGHCAVLRALLDRKALVDGACSQGKTPLLHAGENGHLEACSLLLSYKANPTSCTPDGETLLHVVSRAGDAALIAQVVAWKADLSAQDRDGWSPLHEAAHWGTEAVEALCGAKADVRARSKDGETPLHVALEGFEQASTCEALLRWRADPLAPDNDGETPLHVAARRDSAEACVVLLQGGADVTATDLAGRSPVDLCQKGGEVHGILLQKQRTVAQ
eukprot:TRINITY_DN1528_c0_g2_i1.p1 TRINITY_DN1528_c0_g2~~TRINITY_DN1528_c0_g2_i1.p1  ORF type:complete len:1000 (-),score=231.79 TRINITY_DN1528_c0_g2_i1:8-3007(-)